MSRKTIKKVVHFEGIGLHQGTKNSICCIPNDKGSGIIFRDKSSQNTIALNTNSVVSTQRGTSIQSNGFQVHTIEHLMAAIHALEIDDLIIEIEGDEIPILDGSSQSFYKGLKDSDFIACQGASEQIEIKKRFHFVDEHSGASYEIVPADKFSVECNLIYQDPIIGHQTATLEDLRFFDDEISQARTFVLGSELELLIKANLIKGGNPENALVFNDQKISKEGIKQLSEKLNFQNGWSYDKDIINNLELRYENEPARHKLLDLIGDLYLIGKKIKGKIIATKPGHTGNLNLAKFIEEKVRLDEDVNLKKMYDPTAEAILDINAITELLPHRYPFLLVDKIIEISDNHVVGIKNVTINEPFFRGHFPDNPVFPGVLQMEALAQTGGILAMTKQEKGHTWDTFFMKMNNVKFKKMVLPGDSLILKMELLMPIRQGVVKMKGQAFVKDTLVSEGELVAKIIKRESP